MVAVDLKLRPEVGVIQELRQRGVAEDSLAQLFVQPGAALELHLRDLNLFCRTQPDELHQTVLQLRPIPDVGLVGLYARRLPCFRIGQALVLLRLRVGHDEPVAHAQDRVLVAADVHHAEQTAKADMASTGDLFCNQAATVMYLYRVSSVRGQPPFDNRSRASAQAAVLTTSSVDMLSCTKP
eukprot:CAMPEP_0115128254 /NCGR_PEP_ID=MMETSP0227-20121206/50994_1 /TAXON_ID=89957 /ORGANISM="Polarella glacialis, Strain CCMP 1383" /LENGTH=181 /DNA_ID=CAMNT_0002532713 /DNA_START=151 /DNA_END=697 /DNA_ORIENTATION=+